LRAEPLYAAYKRRLVEFASRAAWSVRRGLRETVVADAHALPFAPAAFDGVWADRTVQHLADPVKALGEMVRVAKPGARVVVADPDYGTQVVEGPDQELADRVLGFRARHGVRHGRLAHRMGGLFVEAGLGDVRVEAMPIVVRDPGALDNAMGLRDWAGLACAHGLVEPDEVAEWQESLDRAAANGCFLYAFSLFITAGRR
jgi:SAM-dependent methyltransferase